MKDYKYTINVENNKEKMLVTDKIVGRFGAILVKTTGMWYNFELYLKDNPDICLFHEDSRDMRNLSKNSFYVIIKTDSYNVNQLSYQAPDFWLLNDELIIVLKAAKNVSVDITLRVID